MKKILITICAIFVATVASADTLNVTWHNEDGTTYDTTMCTVGGTLNLPTAPTKRGYIFQGWKTKYTRIEYLESTGIQYIADSTIPTNGRTGSFEILVENLPVHSRFVGWGNPTSDNAWGTLLATPNVIINDIPLHYGGPGSWNDKTDNTLNIADKNIYKFVYQSRSQEFFVNGVSNKTTTFSWENSSYPFCIFQISGSSFNANGSKVYYVKVWDSTNTLVRDFIPVLDRDGVACMYDKVSKTLFYNAGSGDFIAGPEITE